MLGSDRPRLVRDGGAVSVEAGRHREAQCVVVLVRRAEAADDGDAAAACVRERPDLVVLDRVDYGESAEAAALKLSAIDAPAVHPTMASTFWEMRYCAHACAELASYFESHHTY